MSSSASKFFKNLGFFILMVIILAPVSFGAVYVPWSLLTLHSLAWSATIYTAKPFILTVIVFWVILAIIVLATMIKYGFFSFTKILNHVERSDSDAYGNSRWQTEQEINKNYSTIQWGDLPISDVEGIVVNSKIKRNTLYVSTISKTHSLIVGVPGTGKSTRFLGPSIQMNAASRTKASMIINDLKGELYGIHAPGLRAAGYDVVKFDLGHPSDIHNSHFNPLSLIWDLYNEYKDGGDFDNELIDQVSLLINEVAETICPQSSGDNAIWAQGAQSIVTAIIWGMLEDGLIPEYEMTRDKFTIAQISNIVNRQRNQLENFLRNRAKFSPVFDFAGNILDNPSEKTVASYMSTLSSSLKIFLEEGLKRLTAHTDMDITKISEKPTAIFIVIPERQRTRNVVGTMLLSQIYNQLTYQASKINNRSTLRSVYFLLDEFGNLPKIPNLPKWISLGRSQGLFFTIVVQADSQIEAIYGKDDAATIINNAQLQMLLGANSIDTLKRFSELFGKYTIYQRSANIDQQSVNPDFKGSTSLTSKELITLDQLQRIPEGTAYFKEIRKFPCKASLVAEWDARAKRIILKPVPESDEPISSSNKEYKEQFYDLENREACWRFFWDELNKTKPHKPVKPGNQSEFVKEDPDVTIKLREENKTDSIANTLRLLQD